MIQSRKALRPHRRCFPNQSQNMRLVLGKIRPAKPSGPFKLILVRAARVRAR